MSNPIVPKSTDPARTRQPTQRSVLVEDGVKLWETVTDFKHEVVEGLAAGEFHSAESRRAAHELYDAVEAFQVAVELRLSQLGYSPSGHETR